MGMCSALELNPLTRSFRSGVYILLATLTLELLLQFMEFLMNSVPQKSDFAPNVKKHFMLGAL